MGALTRERGFIGGGAKALQRRLVAVARQPSNSPAEQDRRMQAYATGRTLDLLAQRQGPTASVASSLAKLGLAGC
ncbi:MAG: hypothetical protein Q8K85_09570, partial [Hyphomicrobium sp.]|nr:hypothetical protein [Hyphomicrobium sp.]